MPVVECLGTGMLFAFISDNELIRLMGQNDDLKRHGMMGCCNYLWLNNGVDRRRLTPL